MIYLHLGKPKTGTTTIQSYLYQNRNTLRDNGYLYPDSGLVQKGHHNVYFDLAQHPHFNVNLGGMDLLIREIKDFKDQKKSASAVIISSETFSGANPELLDRLLEPLRALDKLTCILYLRSQQSYLRSFWAHLYRQGDMTYAFPRWAEWAINTNQYGADYQENISLLSEVITKEELKIVVYDKVPKASFCHYFMDLCEYPNPTSLQSLDRDALNVSVLPGGLSDTVSELCHERYATGNRFIASEFLNCEQLFV